MMLFRNICRIVLSDQRIFVPVGAVVLILLISIFEKGSNVTSSPQSVDQAQYTLNQPPADLAQFAQSASITMYDQCETKMKRAGASDAVTSLGKTPDEFCDCIRNRTVSDVEAGGKDGALTTAAAWKALSYDDLNNFWYSLVQECEI